MHIPEAGVYFGEGHLSSNPFDWFKADYPLVNLNRFSFLVSIRAGVRGQLAEGPRFEAMRKD